MTRLVAAIVVLCAVPSLANSAAECALDDVADSVSMMQVDGLHVMSRHQFLQKQVEESADALGAVSAAMPAANSSAAPASGSTEAPAVESAAIPDDASRTPFLASDYVIDGDNENYLQDFEERVAADAAAQPAMVGHHSSGDSSNVLEKQGEGTSNGSGADRGDAEADTDSGGSSGDSSNGTSNGSGADAHALDSGNGSDADVRTNSSDGRGDSADVLANVSAAPIVSHVNRSLEYFGANVSAAPIVSHVNRSLQYFGTSLHTEAPAGNSSVAPANESTEAPAQEPAQSPAGESTETPALEIVDTPVEPLQADVPVEGADHAEAQPGIEGGANIPDDASRTPFLASDYVIDGDNVNYVRDMEKRVAADAAAQPSMVKAATS